ncbi:MAG: RimK family alpha-L-glutamate ligase [Ruminococcaceae bacterium]|nr:RimK family alpha-L-glutamate ligase [Oscillospiraceae bacterium]
MEGTLIVNHGLMTEKYTEQTALYTEAAEGLGITLHVCTNAQRPETYGDFVLFLDKDVVLARTLELAGIPVFNSATSIALCDDKALTYLALKNSGLPMPKTLVVPMTFFETDWTDNPFLSYAEEQLGYPMVVKEACGSFGWQVWLAKDRTELVEYLNKTSPKRTLLQAFVSTSKGRDIRINVVGGKAVASMYRYSEIDFRANISSGGSMKSYIPTPEQEALAIRACELLGLDFGGVDLLFGENEEPLLCEVNSNAHIKNILNCTGVNVAHHILSRIKNTLENKQ